MPGVRFAELTTSTAPDAQMDDSVCAILVEPIQGEGGIHLATPEFLDGLRALADEFDALLIYDEVQCGVGRTGYLWAHQGYCDRYCNESNCSPGHCRFEPDILTAAKPLAGGLPIGAILMRQKVADVMHKGDHGSTFAGGPYITHVAHARGRAGRAAALPGRSARQGRAAPRDARGAQQPAHRGRPRRGADGGRGIGYRGGPVIDQRRPSTACCLSTPSRPCCVSCRRWSSPKPKLPLPRRRLARFCRSCRVTG